MEGMWRQRIDEGRGRVRGKRNGANQESVAPGKHWNMSCNFLREICGDDQTFPPISCLFSPLLNLASACLLPLILLPPFPFSLFSFLLSLFSSSLSSSLPSFSQSSSFLFSLFYPLPFILPFLFSLLPFHPLPFLLPPSIFLPLPSFLLFPSFLCLLLPMFFIPSLPFPSFSSLLRYVLEKWLWVSP